MDLILGVKKVQNSMANYLSDKEWAETYINEVKKKISKISSQLTFVNDATIEEDISRSTDLVLNTIQGKIAVRLRKPDCDYRDLTIRARRDSGAKTELEKIKEGFARWYFYGWVSDKNHIEEYIFVDLNKLRNTSLLERTFIDNKDGTYFIAISKKELKDAGCLVLKEERKEITSNLYFPPGEYKRLFGTEFTREFFDHLKSLNNSDNIACFMSKKFLKKNFEDLEDNEKYHLTVCHDLKGNE